jgi:hypothetical protein
MSNKKTATALYILLLSAALAVGLIMPVVAAPMNFGYASVGDSNASSFGGVFASNFTSPPNIGDIIQIRVYLATGGAQAKAVLYADDNGRPYTLLGESDVVTIEGTSGNWTLFNVAYSGAPNTVYWLGIVLENAGTYYYSTNATEQAIYSAPLSDTLNPIPQGNFIQGNELSIYAVYKAAPSQPSDQSSNLALPLLIVALAGLAVAGIIAVVAVMRRKKKTPQ